MNFLSGTTVAAICSLAALFTSAPAVGQTPVSTITWAQSYGVGFYDANGQPSTETYASTGVDYPVGTVPMPDGGVVVAGYVGLPEVMHGDRSGASPVVVRYGRDGGILWQKHLRNSQEAAGQETATFAVRSVRADAAGNVLVLMSYYGTGVSYYIVARLSPAGSLLWQNAATTLPFITGTADNGQPIIGQGSTYSSANGFTTGETNWIFDVTADGGAIVGNTILNPADSAAHPGSAHNCPCIYKFNPDGTLAFHREYECPGLALTAICARQNNAGYALLLPPINPPAAATRPLVDVVLTDAAGNPVAQRTFNQNGDYNPGVIVASADGGFFFTSAGNNGGIVVHKLAADLTLVWQVVINDFNYYGAPTPTPDGGCLLNAQVDNLAVLVTLDASGNVTASRKYGGAKGTGRGDGPFAPVASCVTTDGTVAFAVDTYDYGSNTTDGKNWWVVKTDAPGNVLGYGGTSLTLQTAGAAFETVPDVASSDWGAAPNNEVPDTTLATTSQPAILVEDLGALAAGNLNKPSAQFQANPATSYNHRLFFGGEAYLDQGVYYLKFAGSGRPFGYYRFLDDPNFLYHFDLGFEYVFDANDGAGGVYFYDFASSDFFYTSPTFGFPYLYDFGLQAFLYYFPVEGSPDRYTSNPRSFYDFTHGQFISK